MEPKAPFAALAGTLTAIWFTVAIEESTNEPNSSWGVFVICAVAWTLSLAAAWRCRNASGYIRKNASCVLCGTISSTLGYEQGEERPTEVHAIHRESSHVASTVWKPALEKIALTFAVVAALGSIALTILMAQECLPDLASLKVPTMSKHVWIFLLGVNPVLGLLARSRLSRTLSFIYGTVVIDIMILGLIMPE